MEREQDPKESQSIYQSIDGELDGRASVVVFKFNQCRRWKRLFVVDGVVECREREMVPARSEAWTGMTVCGGLSFTARSAADRLDAEPITATTARHLWFHCIIVGIRYIHACMETGLCHCPPKGV